MLPYKPRGDKIIIKDSGLVEKTDAGILLPDTVEKGTVLYEVVAIGDKVDSLSVGDIIINWPTTMKAFQYKGTQYLIISELDVVVTLESKEDYK